MTATDSGVRTVLIAGKVPAADEGPTLSAASQLEIQDSFVMRLKSNLAATIRGRSNNQLRILARPAWPRP
jgi:hypothetical protein